nr:carbonic anhydrase [Leptinotarsa decemlineata]
MALDWGYGPTNGPNTWPQCYPEAAGQKQSPIDINPVDLKTLNANKKLEWKYVPENTDDVSNPGYGWKVHVHGHGSGKCYKTLLFGEAAQHPDGLCVLGVFLKPGKKHDEIEKVVAQLGKIEFKGESTKIFGPLNPALLLPENSGYYTYQGSLTTPPCSECVVWIVFKEPIEVSNEQLTAFRNLKSYCKEDSCPCDEFKGYVKSNFRPTLPVGQREVKECRQ